MNGSCVLLFILVRSWVGCFVNIISYYFSVLNLNSNGGRHNDGQTICCPISWGTFPGQKRAREGQRDGGPKRSSRSWHRESILWRKANAESYSSQNCWLQCFHDPVLGSKSLSIIFMYNSRRIRITPISFYAFVSHLANTWYLCETSSWWSREEIVQLCLKTRKVHILNSRSTRTGL